MKITNFICSAGRSGYSTKNWRAVRDGARQDGFAYVDPPVRRASNE